MRILHVIPSMNAADGGPPVIAASLAAAQAALGHDVTLLTYAGRRGGHEGGPLLRSLPAGDRVRLTELPAPGRLERLLARDARAAVAARLRDGIDAVHLHNVWESILRVAAQESRRSRVLYCVLLNGMLDPWSLSQRRWKKRLALALGYRTMLAHAAALHVGNADEQNLIAPLGLPTPTRLIPNGIFPQQVDPLPARDTFRAAHPAVGDRPFVLFLSRLHYKKGLDFLADAFAIVAARYPALQLVLAGPDGGALAPFMARAEAAGLASRVHVVGPIYGASKLAALVDAACFCLPSRQEGFSMAIVEAMACGTPVVISENCHFPEVAAADAGHVVPLNASAVAEAIARVVADPEEAARLGARGRRLILENYTWPRIAERSVEVYREAIATRPTAAP